MAPTSGAGKSTKTAAARPLSGLSLKPAIPYVYLNRRGNASKQTPSTAQPATNGSSLKIQQNAEAATPETVVTELDNRENSVTEEAAVTANNVEEDHSAASTTQPELTPTASTSTDEASEPAPAVEYPEAEPKPTESQTAEELDHGLYNHATSGSSHLSHDLHQPAAPPVKAVQDPAHDIVAAPAAAPATAPVSHPTVISPTPYSMPAAAFQPTPRALGLGTNGDNLRGLPRHGMGGPSHMHHPHPSNGSLQFGHFDSNNSSPVPPHSAGFAPPPGLGGPLNGQRPFHGHGHTVSGHGYPPQMPYGTEFVPVTSGDSYGRSSAAPAGMEPYPHHVNNYGPSTPHSFQDSQSSHHAEEPATFGHHHGLGGPNGVAANQEDRRHHHQQQQQQHAGYGPPHQRMMSNHMPPPHMMQQMQEAQNGVEGLFGYLQSQFTDLAFVDCTLELRYLDERAPPVRIPGHRLIFARSQPLRNLLQNTNGDGNSRGMGAQTILLKTDDKYINSGTFWMAIQRLYAFPLLNGPPEGAAMGDGGLTLAGNAETRFDFALGYAAAGKLLNWESTVQRGMQVAADHLSWSTLEKALEFILSDLPGRASADRHAPFPYGEQVQILMTGVISFIINNFPAYFRLDTSVSDPESFSRIPAVPAPAKSTSTPPIAHGTSVHLGASRRARPMHIKFGDMGSSPASQDGANGGEVHNLTSQQRAINTTLSRVLLNLPFAYLKPALESTVYGNVSSWANSEARHQIMLAVVSERELRRLRALEGVKESRVPHAGQIRHSLQSVEPRHGGDVWHILGWQEEMVPFHAEGASLGRKWTPLVYPREGGGADHQYAAAAYP